MSDELAPGSEFGDFTIEELIGEGGMGLVYRALQRSLDRRVALKIITPRLADDITFHERFRREARKAAAVDHPAIVPIYGTGEVDGRPYLAMRFIPGTDLGTLLRAGGPMPVPRALAIADQIASALDAAHGDGLIHRDVKPANILVEATPGGERAYLTDFGLTRSRADTSLTQTGTFMGSPLYMSPEQIQGGDLDARADQYSLACVVYEALTGTPPFQTQGQLQAIYAHLHTPPPQLSAALPDLAPAVDAVLARALAKQPADRYGSCRDFVAALGAAAGLPEGAIAARAHVASPLSGSAATAGVPIGDLRSQPVVAAASGAAAICWAAAGWPLAAVIAIVVVLLSSGSGTPHPHVSTTGTSTTVTRAGSLTRTTASALPTTAKKILDLANQPVAALDGSFTVVNGNQSGTMDLVTNQYLITVRFTNLKGVSQEWLVPTGAATDIKWWCSTRTGKWLCYPPAKIPEADYNFIQSYLLHTVNFSANAVQYGFTAVPKTPHPPKPYDTRQAGQPVACFSTTVNHHKRGLCVTAAGAITDVYATLTTGYESEQATRLSTSTTLPKGAFTKPAPYVKGG